MSSYETETKDFNTGSAKVTVVEKIINLMGNGDCFELIDGENLEFKDIILKEVF